MMTQEELFIKLESTGLPVAYHHFKESTKLPYLIYLFSSSRDLIADNANYKAIDNFDIELYSDKKDTASEKLVQDKLKEINTPYRKYETYIQSEKMYQVIYEIQLI